MKDLQSLPKVRDSLTYLYVEHCRIEQEAKSITLFDQRGSVAIPCAALNLLMLGPGTALTHAAMRSLAENGCMVVWTGEGAVRVYAHSTGETRSSRNLLRQAVLASDPTSRMEVIDRMYRVRFTGEVPPGLSLQQLRGREGLRVRAAYASAAAETGVEWSGRFYDRGDWRRADPINRALSTAASALYGVCHAAIVASGYSPGLGFIHTGRMLSFVYDIADLYRAELAIPIAFRTVAEGTENLESRVRRASRDAFYRGKLLERVIPDIARVLGEPPANAVSYADDDGAVPTPGWLWDPAGDLGGGVSYGDSAHRDVGDEAD
ncbi:MAG TPA: type I-E CRISPR-associated endonuclease Cas1e [Tepidiformaceae bacterium]|nr:type I-E CRISPR-associated endonuclease Cas1e [Tepidiformaceae bacterium]